MKTWIRTPIALVALGIITVMAPAQEPPKTAPTKPPTQAKPLGNAEPISAEQKESVIKGMADVLMTKAFVPGVDFKKWTEFLDKKKEEIDKADSVATFGGVLNRALRDFGFSHIRLQTPRAAAQRGADFDRRFGSHGNHR